MQLLESATGASVATLVNRSWDALLDVLSPKRKFLKELRTRWGARGDKTGFLAGLYFELTSDGSSARQVDDKTWTDLEFPEIFSRMDTTVTPVGSQVLFAQLRRYLDDPGALAQRHANHAALARNARLREHIQLRLAPLRDDSCADIAELLFADRPERPNHDTLIKAWSLGSLLLLVLVVAFGWPAWI